MPILKTETKIVRVPLVVPGSDLHDRIIQECELQSSRNEGRRLAAAFESHDQLVLIFQIAPA